MRVGARARCTNCPSGRSLHQGLLNTIVGRTIVFTASMIVPYAKRVARSGRGNSPESAFGLVLRSARESHRLSQEELGARSGYHRTYIGQLERGEKSPSLRTIFNLSSVLKVSPSVLVRRVERSV